ncbi:uncharacterized protein TOT_010000990 [Theileria orientalis strain Shintoku]|uniref:Uncharacterized protein n=1 Tax=Theileria orientalis strain Shintoku TaxID=869250 RepID=J4D6F0_THEOR|nr:uncharacterized protein TOT_010000990 [Theileria orientalis strain Shintoku]BAM39535.1 uncharacterized protein TOT_010000990 [Theileria orientalis strain Shintoku]|eukprot:XP_009689836.1 uncharacterized protein TOT_010000990 [Theileria orientalis strain Shintoku]
MTSRLYLRPLHHIFSGLPALKLSKSLIMYPQSRFATSSSKPASTFAVPVTETKLFSDFVESSVDSYNSSRDVVDSEMAHLLSSHKLLLFMEGSVDSPKSLCAANIVKIFTLLQVLDFHTVDVLSNREVFGFLCSKLGEPARNVLFKDGSPFAGHDELLALFKSGKLLEALGVSRPYSSATHKQFRKQLPVATF